MDDYSTNFLYSHQPVAAVQPHDVPQRSRKAPLVLLGDTISPVKPQDQDRRTSGGLRIAVSSDRLEMLGRRMRESGLFYARIGTVTELSGTLMLIP